MTEFDIIRNDGRLLYEYIRGSNSVCPFVR